MPRRPASITQADVARVVRAAQQAGAPQVEVRPDGTILINLTVTKTNSEKPKPPARPAGVVM